MFIREKHIFLIICRLKKNRLQILNCENIIKYKEPKGLSSMNDMSMKKNSLILVEGISLVLVTSLFFSLGFGFYFKDVLFVEGLIMSIIGVLSIMGNRVNDLWINIEHNGLTSANDDVKIMEKDSRKLIESFRVEKSSLIIAMLGISFLIMSYLI